jgi:hypothetical protein
MLPPEEGQQNRQEQQRRPIFKLNGQVPASPSRSEAAEERGHPPV